MSDIITDVQCNALTNLEQVQHLDHWRTIVDSLRTLGLIDSVVRPDGTSEYRINKQGNDAIYAFKAYKRAHETPEEARVNQWRRTMPGMFDSYEE